MNYPDLYIVGAARTAIGTFGGALKDTPLAQLATVAVSGAIARSASRPIASGTLSWAT